MVKVTLNEHQTFPISQVIYNSAVCYLEDSPHKARLSGQDNIYAAIFLINVSHIILICL